MHPTDDTVTFLEPSGGIYVCVFVDSASDFVYVKILKSKKNTYQAFKEIICDVGCPREFMLDWGTEFQGKTFQLCLDRGIRVVHSPPYTPEHNARVGRMNRSLKDHSRCMLLDGGCKPELWGHAIYGKADF